MTFCPQLRTAILLLLATNTFASERTVFVHLFEWTWKDIAKECETYLGPKGFAGVQVSPPNEHAVLPGYPWYQRYQPTSYQLESRSGTRQEFIDMVRRCKAVGVDIYVDAVINHMTWVNRSGETKYGINGTGYDEYRYHYVYEPWDFHRCGRNGDDSISNYQDRWEVQNCNVATCADLKTETDYVRGKIANYLNDLLNIGVAGFRIDATKHIPAEDLKAILGRLNRSSYVYQEVIDNGGEPIRASDYYDTGDVTEFRYARQIAHTFNSGKLAWFEQFGEKWGFSPSDKAIVFTDNHDIQRGHGGGGEVLTYKDGRMYMLANVFMLAWPYGYPQVMSSYAFGNSDQGPPTNDQGQTRRVYKDGSQTPNCGPEWQCEHRWQAISNMVAFRNYTRDAFFTSKWWTDGNNRIAFGRGNLGYVIINRDPETLRQWFDTGLPSGDYCDVISGDLHKGRTGCSGKTIHVNKDGWANVTVEPFQAVAIHGGAKL